MRAAVLLVDDDEDMLAVLARWCQGDGFDVECAKDGYEALYKLRGRQFDLVVTDLEMPGLHGLKLIEMLKTYDADIQIVVLTGQGTLQAAVEALREGKAFDFLRKPLKDLAVLSNSLSRALERRRTTARKKRPEPRDLEDLPDFTERERAIAKLLAEGMHPDEIADELALGKGTVRNSLSIIYQRLDVKNRAEAVVALRMYRLG
ncbi:MAG: response regulator transcription factor [Candidatus Sericytochromatia bacterium]|nr:response regulator transcription factor [Candidatus Tanganyikabacteria bacterium]